MIMLPTVNWDAVATAAVAAIIFNLALDYLAKPRLEARKEEILEAHRLRRELLASAIRITYAAAIVSAVIPDGADSTVRGNVYVEQDRQHDRLQAEVQQLADDGSRHAGTFLGSLLNLVVGYVSALQGLLMSARPRTDQAVEIQKLAGAMAIALSSPRRWQIGKIVARARALEAMPCS
ncbi:hypothetical protein FH608_050785 [Nonomuraea phyllanthi]|uniref:Uncharacterized protein n=1 Tax=Nonomuraea phyllanthi TaxID=2219224 RepID=A0A5C4USJ9_9ACTN|nr:hypothetical protein [Nonomuraea phyllanthi]KAB8181808.1 hypothetical protein FH608_050785 [Nonomuraea phyllanthi]